MSEKCWHRWEIFDCEDSVARNKLNLFQKIIRQKIKASNRAGCFRVIECLKKEISRNYQRAFILAVIKIQMQ